MSNRDALTSPYGIGGRVAPSRVVFGPHETNLCAGRAISPRSVAYYERRARGGAGIVVAESASVHPSDWPYERAPLATECGPGWRDTVAACRPHDTLVLAGLTHTGSQGSSAYSRRELWAPSRVADPGSRELPKEMETADIAAVVDGFACAAEVAIAADVDGVEIDAGASGLLRQFHSGLTNRRTDGYGTDRLRLTREVLTAVRAVLGPERIVALRLSCDELAPWAGITPEIAAGHASTLGEFVDLLTVVRGGSLDPSGYRPDAHGPEGFNTDLCRQIHDRIAGRAAVVLQGSLIDPAQAQRAIDGGVAELVEMTRAQIADPDLVRTWRSGRSPRPCVLCNQACLVRDVRNPIVTCIGNPDAGYESRTAEGTAGPPRRALVVGGGPAGLEAARVLATRGHRVTLRERETKLGGMTRRAAVGESRRRLAHLTDWLEDECRRLGVAIEVGTEVRSADIDATEAIILATGSMAAPPRYPIGADVRYFTAPEVLSGNAILDGPVLLDDPVGGPVAVALAELLAARGF
ncbi:MAG: mycofactocin system FadH/OYE family oxidoreductase 1, partial [Aldersonia sp.]|nr:mycofactocin system FadH/OYE family oxidoreductase 1 [Aldersonia sp.]